MERRVCRRRLHRGRFQTGYSWRSEIDWSIILLVHLGHDCQLARRWRNSDTRLFSTCLNGTGRVLRRVLGRWRERIAACTRTSRDGMRDLFWRFGQRHERVYFGWKDHSAFVTQSARHCGRQETARGGLRVDHGRELSGLRCMSSVLRQRIS